LRLLNEDLAVVEEAIHERTSLLHEVENLIHAQAAGISSVDSSGRLRLHSVSEHPTDDSANNDTAEASSGVGGAINGAMGLGDAQDSLHKCDQLLSDIAAEEQSGFSPARPCKREVSPSSPPCVPPLPLMASVPQVASRGAASQAGSSAGQVCAAPEAFLEQAHLGPAPAKLCALAESGAPGGAVHMAPTVVSLAQVIVPNSPRGLAVEMEPNGSRGRVLSAGKHLPYPARAPTRRSSPEVVGKPPRSAGPVNRHTIGVTPVGAFMEVPGAQVAAVHAGAACWRMCDASRAASPVTPRPDSKPPSEVCRSATPLSMAMHARLIASSSSTSTPHMSSPRATLGYTTPAGPFQGGPPVRTASAAAPPPGVTISPPTGSRSVSAGRIPCRVAAPTPMVAPGAHSPSVLPARFSQIMPQTSGTGTPQVAASPSYRTASPGIASPAVLSATAMGRSSSRGATATTPAAAWMSTPGSSTTATAPGNSCRYNPACATPQSVCNGRFVPVSVPPEGVHTQSQGVRLREPLQATASEVPRASNAGTMKLSHGAAPADREGRQCTTPRRSPGASAAAPPATPGTGATPTSSRYAYAGSSVLRDYQPNPREVRRRGR